ncbi:hypothetical protein ANN_10212 [Periplaneta americana]|uniref:Reverse transcriptase domain-containing protein n=1 Tax=Periplaneta americana TaxID=6978 RepID=A0ABQ8TNE1_PERAM|nr:hypothetical protein ANN_10212 [Periplaneta americana]
MVILTIIVISMFSYSRLIYVAKAAVSSMFGDPSIVNSIGSPTYALSKFLTSLLGPHVGKTNSYIRDSTHFIERLKTLVADPQDILVSFDVVSLFTKVPISNTMVLLRNIFSEDIVTLFQHVLTTTYFQWQQKFYEQTDGVAMGSPLSPVIANFYMEAFEEATLETATLKPSCWYRYVDDTFVIWKHGRRTLEDFLLHLNSQHEQIQFTMETEKDGQLPFLDVLVYRQENGALGHKVYRKPTHTDRYLHKDSNHHPRQKRAMIKTLFDRAIRVSDPQHLDQEIDHLHSALTANGYAKTELKRALKPRKKTTPESGQDHTKRGTVFLPYHKQVTDRISKILNRHKVDTIFLPTKQIRNSLRSAKDKRDRLSSTGSTGSRVHVEQST